jgi:hypothetical protein
MAKRSRNSPPSVDPDPLEIPMPDSGIGSASFWDNEIEDSTRKLQDVLTEWKANLARYEGAKPKIRGFRSDDAVNVNVQFYTTENKKPQLFFQVPQITAKALRQDSQAAAPLVQSIINKRLEADDIDAADLVGSVLDDCLITAGIGGSKIGYDEVAEMVDVPTGRREPAVDPFGQPQLDAMGQPVLTLALDPKTGQPETTPIKKIMWSRIYWSHISPADLRFPIGFTGAHYDDAPWIAWRFNVDENFARSFNINAGAGQALPEDLTLLSDRDRDKLMTCGTGYEIFYKAALYDPEERNPDRIRRLVLVSSSKRGRRKHSAIIHENSPWQVFGPDGRFLTGMRGYPIHPLCIRPLTERTYPKSDCSVVRDLADEKSLTRTLMVQQRRRNLPIRGFNKNAADAEAIKKIENAETQEMIGFTGDPREQLFQLPQAALPQETFAFDSIIQQDLDRLSATGSNQQGLTSEANSATESALIQKALETRLAKERNRVLAWFTAGVKKVFALVQLFASDEDVALVLDADGAEQYRAWTRAEIQGRFAFALKADSALRIDAQDERNHFLRLFNLAANHPAANSTELLRMLAAAWGLDPTKIIKPPMPPPPPPAPEKPKLSISIKGEDLDPTMPQYANVVALLRMYDVDKMAAPGPAAPGAPAAAGGAPGGPRPTPPPSRPGGPPGGAPRPVRAVRPVTPVNQHDADLTGQMTGPGPKM